jgi:serine/threonine protein kinase
LTPEYFLHGKFSDKIDVYAFGVVLLELVSGRKPVSAGGPKGQESHVMLASSVVREGKLMDVFDPCLPPARDGEAERMTLAAALCINPEPQRRPTMSNVTKNLSHTVPISVGHINVGVYLERAN